MWLSRTATLLASACLLGALSSHALWPHPVTFTSSKVETFVRISNDLRFQLADTTDQTRVPDDLKEAIDAAAKLANTIDLWDLSADRGENYRRGVEKAPLVSSVYITVLELMPETTPNPCVKGEKAEQTVGTVINPRALQQPFQGRKQVDDPVTTTEDLTPEGQRALAGGFGAEGDIWANTCSIASRSIKELSYNSSSKPLNLETDKAAPEDLGSIDAEMYRLFVPSDGSSIQLKAYTALGALRGLQTLLQLIYALPPKQAGKIESQRFIRSVPITITDHPAYPYRGLLLDTARNFFDIPTIRKLIDTMSFVKLNQLHWHATDTQSFPLAFTDIVDAKPGNYTKLSTLAERGSYGYYKAENGEAKKMVYTEADVREIINYAAARGVNVIIETDMPAHMLAGVQDLFEGQLMACPNVFDWQSVAAEPPSGQLRLVSNSPTLDTTDVATFKVPYSVSLFVTDLLRKVSSLSKSLYVSSGGDEPNHSCWNLTEEMAMEPYLTKFMSLVTDVTSASGKKGMVWEEMATKFPAVAKTLAPGSLVEIWNDANSSGIALTHNPNVNILLAPVNYFYLDCGGGQFLGNTTANLWCPYVSWQQTYSFDPSVVIANATAALSRTAAKLTDKQIRQKFMGGEHAIWSETIDPTNLEAKTWPRAAAGAEIFWTGEQVNGVKRDANEALPRMMDLRWRLKEMGVKAEPLQPQWCAERPGMCNLHH
ncbi:probable putative exochitinase [Ustilago trichophora]|uniref:beta-N-acetylhexosaminidase n=1 Tax=Ustilago trichophora TaxID=86804 RepID=A0A5C3DW78_9BASI|nr:probable putative exochitinase [Ustilago trichophora]